MLDVGKLATLREVVRLGSFSAAAQRLALTQPAVSRQVSLLERRLGTQLVRRGRSGTRPTEAGRLLVEHTEAILSRLTLAEAEVGELAALRRGTVRMGSFLSALVRLSALVGAVLARRHPLLVVLDDLVDADTALAKLGRGELDIAVIFEHDFEPRPVPGGVRVLPLFVDPVRVLLPAGHRLARADRVDLDELRGERWIRAHEGSAARLVEHVLHGHGLAPELLLAGHGDEPVEAQALVAAGRGVTLVHDLNVLLSPAELAVRPLAGNPGARRVRLAVPESTRAPAVLAAVEALLEVAEADPATWGGAPSADRDQ